MAFNELDNVRTTQGNSRVEMPPVWARVAPSQPPPDLCLLYHFYRTEDPACVFIVTEDGKCIEVE